MSKTRVRFHLAKGENYMKWQVKSPDSTEYYDPQRVRLHMVGCKLRNVRGTADKICNEGADKTVCAWVECDSVRVEMLSLTDVTMSDGNDVLYYNPRILPHWFDTRVLGKPRNIDNWEYDNLITNYKYICTK